MTAEEAILLMTAGEGESTVDDNRRQYHTDIAAIQYGSVACEYGRKSGLVYSAYTTSVDITIKRYSGYAVNCKLSGIQPYIYNDDFLEGNGYIYYSAYDLEIPVFEGLQFHNFKPEFDKKNRRGFLGYLINYYLVATATNEPYGMFIPYMYGIRCKKTKIIYTDIPYADDNANSVMVGIYDSDDNCIYSTCVINKPSVSNYYNYGRVKKDGVSLYTTKKPYDALPVYIDKPGIYTSRVIYTREKLAPTTQEIQFEVILEDIENGNDERVVEIDHGIYNDINKTSVEFYCDVPQQSILYADK